MTTPAPHQETALSLPVDVAEADGQAWRRFLHRRTQLLLDLVVLAGAFALAYLLRFDFNIPPGYVHSALVQLPLVLLVQFLALVASGVYAFVWRYFGLRELGSFVRASLFWFLPLLALRLLLPSNAQAWKIPLSVLMINALLALVGLLALRIGRRVFYERFERDQRTRDGAVSGRRAKRTFLIGAGAAGVLALRELQSRGEGTTEVVGFIDDDPLKTGSIIYGVKVLGTTRELPRLAAQYQVDQAVITIVEADAEIKRRLVELCDRTGLPVRTVPGYYEILQGQLAISRFRDVAPEELLQRDPVRLETQTLERFLGGRTVLVTGAGGSIGSELAQQVARFGPGRLVLVDRAEFALFEVERRLRQLWPLLEVVPRVADVGDPTRIGHVIAAEAPEVVIHAAAHKHVPLMESNEVEAIRNNALGTEVVARLAGELGARSFVLVSTDKAVHPSSIMGASKRLAELAIQSVQSDFPHTRYVAVRFGNVLGSAGSVIPIFREQIAAGGPVTVTHPDMMRYFMTIPEAAQLVLQAGAMGSGGEIFVLDMGEPVRILDLAREMIRLTGYEPDRDIEIRFTGTRPGEKLFEELGSDSEGLDKTRHPKILIGRIAGLPATEVRRILGDLAVLVAQGDAKALRAYLAETLPENRLARAPTLSPAATSH